MPILYSDLGLDKQLNEIIFAGSHDAGVTAGGRNTKTQDLDIAGQASAGVRFFDIRIIGAKSSSKLDGRHLTELKAYHGVGPKSTTAGVDRATLARGDTTTKTMVGGEFGMSLSKMLRDAKGFVGANPTEFLILKFDKCDNWAAIADACRALLGGALYRARGNLNTKTLRELQGKVVCAFMGKGYTDLADKDGITRITNLMKPPAGYDPAFDGLQYWGSGGTSVMTPFTGFDGKVRDNVAKQSGILAKASSGIQAKTQRHGFLWLKKKRIPGCVAADPDVVGMMYWTSTGVFASIRKRNDVMWSDRHVAGLARLWEGGFDSWVANALPANVDPFAGASGTTLKMFMPNIVMIDFADDARCQEIYDLNTLAATKITRFFQGLEAALPEAA